MNHRRSRCVRLALKLALATLATVGAASAALADVPAMTVVEQSGIALHAPAGWQVQIDAASGVVFMQEDPSAKESPTIAGLLSPDPSVTPDQLLQLAVSNIIPEPTSTGQTIGSPVWIIEGATNEGIDARMAIVADLDPATGRAMAWFFVATPERFDALGGVELLAAVLSPPAAAAAAGTDGLPDGFAQMLPYEQAVWLIEQGAAPDQAALVGTWSDAVAVPTGDAWEPGVGGATQWGSRGYGTSITLEADGSYALYYRYELAQMACTSRVGAAETGTWQVDGRTLTLDPAITEAELCPCSCTTPTRLDKRDEPPRQLSLGAAPDGGTLGVKMPCTDYMISCAQDGTLTGIFAR